MTHAIIPTLHHATFVQAKTPITVVTFNGRSWWIARQVGKALGMQRWKIFAKSILNRWSDKMEPEKHYLLLTGELLAAFREAVCWAKNNYEGCSKQPSSAKNNLHEGCSQQPSSLVGAKHPASFSSPKRAFTEPFCTPEAG